MNFGERLRNLREDNDETQKEIADLIFVSNKVISDYERGQHFPRDEKAIINLAKHFDVSIDYLFGITDVKNYNNTTKILSDINNLPSKEFRQLLEYLEFLKFKASKNAPQK